MGLQRVGHNWATLTFIFHPSRRGLCHKDSDSPHTDQHWGLCFYERHIAYSRNFHGLCDMVEHFKKEEGWGGQNQWSLAEKQQQSPEGCWLNKHVPRIYFQQSMKQFSRARIKPKISTSNSSIMNHPYLTCMCAYVHVSSWMWHVS